MSAVAVATLIIEFEAIECAHCSMIFGMPGQIAKARKNDKLTFYCPNGHQNHYGQSEIDRLRARLGEQVRIATEQAARAAQAEKEARKTKTALVNLKKRIKEGKREWKLPKSTKH